MGKRFYADPRKPLSKQDKKQDLLNLAELIYKAYKENRSGVNIRDGQNNAQKFKNQ